MKALSSQYGNERPRPDTIEDELIMYTQAIVNGLNLQERHKFYIENVIPTTEGGLSALIFQEKFEDRQYLNVRMSAQGEFLIEIHNSRSVELESFMESTIAKRYFTFEQSHTLEGEQQTLRFRMPLRQLKSRNLLDYSFFILGHARPFMEAMRRSEIVKAA